jgi:hypothetical protein
MIAAPSLACGFCLDGSLLFVFPFFLYWTVVFVGWLLIGGWVAVFARIRGIALPVSPFRWFLWALATLAVTCVPLMGALITPLAFVESVWLFRLGNSLLERRRRLRARGLKRSCATEEPAGLPRLNEPLVRFAYSLQTIAFMACLGLIVPAYIRLVARMMGYA